MYEKLSLENQMAKEYKIGEMVECMLIVGRIVKGGKEQNTTKIKFLQSSKWKLRDPFI